MNALLQVGVDGQWLTERPTGIGNYVLNLLREVVELDCGVRFTLYSDSRIMEACRPLGQVVEGIGPRLKKPLWLSSTLLPHLRRDAPAVFWGTNGFLPLRMPRGIGSVVTVYDLVHRYAPATMAPVPRWRQRLLQPLAVKAADRVVAISQATADQVLRHYGRQPELVLHPRMDGLFQRGVDASERERVRAKYELPAQFLLSIGTLEPRKNLLGLLDAYGQLRANPGAVPPLILAGSRGWMDGKIQRRVQELVDAGELRWLGFVPQEDMPGLYAACTLFVFVPFYEGFGMPVREALLSGCPVLASDLPVLREAGGGFPAYTAADPASISTALRRYLDVIALTALPPAPQRSAVMALERGTADDFVRVLREAAAARRRS